MKNREKNVNLIDIIIFFQKEKQTNWRTEFVLKTVDQTKNSQEKVGHEKREKKERKKPLKVEPRKGDPKLSNSQREKLDDCGQNVNVG